MRHAQERLFVRHSFKMEICVSDIEWLKVNRVCYWDVPCQHGVNVKTKDGRVTCCVLSGDNLWRLMSLVRAKDGPHMSHFRYLKNKSRTFAAIKKQHEERRPIVSVVGAPCFVHEAWVCIRSPSVTFMCGSNKRPGPLRVGECTMLCPDQSE